MKLAIKNTNKTNDLIGLRSLPQSGLVEQQIVWVDSEDVSYMYFSNATSGDEVPDDQSNNLGCWFRDNTVRYDSLCYIVDDSYDFVSNSATDVSSIENWENFNNIDDLTRRDEVRKIYESTTFGSLTSKERKIVSKWMIPNKSDRDTVFDDEEQKEKIEELIERINKSNLLKEANNLYTKDSIESYINKSDNTSFGKDYYYSENDFEENTNSSWVEHASLSLSELQNGQYRASWYCELGGTSTNKRIQFRVQLNNTDTIGSSVYEPEDNKDWVSFSGFKRIDITDGNLVLDLDYGINQNGTTAKIRNARIELWRVS